MVSKERINHSRRFSCGSNCLGSALYLGELRDVDKTVSKRILNSIPIKYFFQANDLAHITDPEEDSFCTIVPAGLDTYGLNAGMTHIGIAQRQNYFNLPNGLDTNVPLYKIPCVQNWGIIHRFGIDGPLTYDNLEVVLSRWGREHTNRQEAGLRQTFFFKKTMRRKEHGDSILGIFERAGYC